MNRVSRVFIIGSNGYIGKSLTRSFADAHYEVVGLDRCSSDLAIELTSPEAFDYQLLDPSDYAIFTAAISSPDACLNDYNHAWAVNVTGTVYCIERMLKQGVRVLFFSSDAVYSSQGASVYNENSPTDPQFAYGKMKAAVENHFLGEKDFKALRLSYVASPQDKLTSYLLSCIQSGQEARIYHPYYRNVVCLSDVIKIVIWLEKNWNSFDSQFLNCAGTELVSKVRMADEISRWVSEISYSIEFPGSVFYMGRPAITQMESIYLYNLGIIRTRSFSEAYRQELEGIQL